MRRFKVLGALSVATAFIVAACGGDDESAYAAAPAAAPSTLADITSTLTPESDPNSRYVWELSVVDDNEAKPSLALDPGGTPHIAYILEAMPGFVNHGVLGSDAWDISTVSTGYFYGPLDIQVDETGMPHIAWHNHDEENEAYAAFVDGEWVVHDIDHPGHDGWDNSLALDSNGHPHTASIDPIQFGSQSGVEYATLDGGRWRVEEVGSGPVPYEFGTRIVLDAQDRPHVVWFDASAKELKYTIRDEGVWQISTVDSEGDVGRFPSLVLDQQGNPTVSYYEAVGRDVGYIKLARWDGQQWDVQRIDELEEVFLGHFGARKTSSLVLDQDDNPIVAYSDEQVIKLAWWDGSQWNLEMVLTAGNLPLGQQVSLAIDDTGVLHLTFADVSRKGGPGVKGTVMYTKGTPRADAR